jgi:hypothetical protein
MAVVALDQLVESAVELLETFARLLQTLAHQLALILGLFLDPHHTLAPLDLAYGWRLAERDLDEPLAEVLLDELDIFFRQRQKPNLIGA